jgi:hypothetical protein
MYLDIFSLLVTKVTPFGCLSATRSPPYQSRSSEDSLRSMHSMRYNHRATLRVRRDYYQRRNGAEMASIDLLSMSAARRASSRTLPAVLELPFLHVVSFFLFSFLYVTAVTEARVQIHNM